MVTGQVIWPPVNTHVPESGVGGDSLSRYPDTHCAVTWKSCLTSPKSGISSGRLIKQVTGQVVLIPLYIHVAEGGVSLGKLITQVSRYSLTSYSDKLSDFPKVCCFIGKTH